MLLERTVFPRQNNVVQFKKKIFNVTNLSLLSLISGGKQLIAQWLGIQTAQLEIIREIIKTKNFLVQSLLLTMNIKIEFLLMKIITEMCWNTAVGLRISDVGETEHTWL